jgi:predicted ester cyclase
MTEQNRETIRRWVEDMWNKGDRQLCTELMATDFVEHAHAPFSDHEPGRVDGPETMRTSMDWLLGQFPDLTMRIQALIVEGDIAALRVSSEGTNLGRLNGRLPPSGKRFHADQSHWFRLEHGKIAEHWATRDDLVSMLQLGVVSKPRLAALVRQLPAAVAHRLRDSDRG